MNLGIVFILNVLFIAGCASRPLTPKVEDVLVSRDDAAKNCKEMGKVTGTSLSAKAKANEALQDLKKEAANKGANYVVVKEYSGQETTVTGIAYLCN